MKLRLMAGTVTLTMVAMISGSAVAQAASNADKAFVAKVSQGGMYEVEAGKVAAARATTPAVKDFAMLEVQDHEGVGDNLKRVANASGVTFSSSLNAEFAARLAKLKAVPQAQFEAYYWKDMKQIHNKDEGLFLQEVQQGTTPYKDFAHQTAVLVKAHLGWLNTM